MTTRGIWTYIAAVATQCTHTKSSPQERILTTHKDYHTVGTLTVPVRFQVEEIVMLAIDDEIDRPKPRHGVDRELPHTLRELFTGLFCHVHPLWYTLRVRVRVCMCVLIVLRITTL